MNAMFAVDAAAARMIERWGEQALASIGGFGGYQGARLDRRATQNWHPSWGSADADTIPDLPVLRRRSRDAARNTPLATGAIERLSTLAIGAGLTALPQIDRVMLGLEDEAADAWERQAARRFALYAESTEVDFSDVQDFCGLQRMTFGSTLESGDVLAVKRYLDDPAREWGNSFQFYEADQLSNPDGVLDGAENAGGNRVIGGVEVDPRGRVVAYHIRNRHPGELNGGRWNDRFWTRLPIRAESGRRQTWLLYDRKRIGQTRGIPYLAPVLEHLKQLGTYSEAELMAAVIGAMITVVHKSKTGQPLANIDPNAAGATGPDPEGDYTMTSGSVFDIDSEDELQVPSLGRPNAQFDPFFNAVLRQIGAALGIPFEVLTMNFTASYSASKAALEMAWQFIRGRRAWLAKSLCQGVYETAIEEDILRDRLAAPGFLQSRELRQAWLGCAWIGPGKMSLNPLQENQADKVAQDEGWETRAEITARRTGDDWEAKHAQSVKEQRMRRRDGLAASAASKGEQAPPSDKGDGEDQ